ncbi:MAG: hypothetical protein ABF876_07120 [Acetobacter aceti]|uniref:Uncharacterized protein n=1 Tax=Acetobacter aceti TaxID=435 RepID=A0A1U9KDD9_ACEAC|nr:hypothetical protein [Acetobacter aceti]AQS83747.1 hypothetical protein A0U92_02025 [Acetobacter aceti]
MISTDLISVLSRPGDRAAASRAGRKKNVGPADTDETEGSSPRRSRRLAGDLDLDGPMPVFRRRGYYLDLLI